MRRVVLAFMALLLPAALAAAPMRPLPNRQLDVAPKEVILGWINGFRHHPEPVQVPLAVKGLSRLGILTDTEGVGVYVGFLAGVFAKNPDKIDALIARMFPLTDEHQWAIVRAIAYSGLPDWRTVLQRNAERMPARRVISQRSFACKLPPLRPAAVHETQSCGA